MTRARLFVCLITASLGVAGGMASQAESATPTSLRTAVTDTYVAERSYSVGLTRIRSAGASIVRTTVSWSLVAPTAPAPGGDDADPSDPMYRWNAVDARFRQIAGAGLEPLAVVADAPRWARQARDDRDALPDPTKLAAFAQAAARRYSGQTPDVPLVRYWQFWNEPNLSIFFHPQLERGRPVSPLLYRQLLQAFTPGIRRGNPAARVIAGGLSPFAQRRQYIVVAPMAFMRQLLCVSAHATPRRSCRTRVPFDIWAHHPYTSGGPTHEAFRRDDVSLGDLVEMRRLLETARRFGHVDSRGGVGFWVTEFSWDTSPPDPKGVPAALHARWTAEALYRMWTAGVSLVTWFQLRDEPLRRSPFQSGLWYRGSTLQRDRPKPALQAFRFPLVAFPQRGRTFVWGRTPHGEPGSVVVERSFRGGWARLGVLRTNRHGIFTARFRGATRTGYVRARLVQTGERARPFSLRDPGDRIVNAFGS